MFLSFLACGELVAANEISREVKIKIVILIWNGKNIKKPYISILYYDLQLFDYQLYV